MCRFKWDSFFCLNTLVSWLWEMLVFFFCLFWITFPLTGNCRLVKRNSWGSEGETSQSVSLRLSFGAVVGLERGDERESIEVQPLLGWQTAPDCARQEVWHIQSTESGSCGDPLTLFCPAALRVPGSIHFKLNRSSFVFLFDVGKALSWITSCSTKYSLKQKFA